MQTKNRSFKSHIQIFLILFFSASLILSASIFMLLNDRFKDSLAREIKVFTDLTSQSIDNYFDVPEEYLFGIKDHIEEFHVTPEIVEPNCIIVDVVEFTKTFENVFLINSDGTVINSWPYDENYIGIDMSNQDYFIDSGDDNSIYWSDIFISPKSGYKTVALSIKTDKGTAAAYYNLNQLSEFISLKLPDDNDFIAVTDAHGNVIASTASGNSFMEENLRNMDSVKAAASGSWGVFTDTFNGRKGIANVVRLDKGGFIVVVFKDYDSLFKYSQTIYILFMVLMAFLTGLSLIFIFIVLNKFFMPLDSLQQNIMLAASGSYNQLDIDVHQDFKPLIESFSLMIDKIRSREDELKKSIAERDTLIWELNHRTKNNMQLISGFSRLYLLSNPDADPFGIMSKIQSKIETISLVHDKLYGSSDLSSINFREYIEDLVPSLTEGLSSPTLKISYSLDVENFNLLLDYAVPCGLVINEFITNSFKYAFASSSEGFIEIKVTKTESNYLEVFYRDNGKGLPEGFDILASETIGFKIIDNIIRNQLRGQMEILQTEGFSCKFQFSLDTYKERI